MSIDVLYYIHVYYMLRRIEPMLFIAKTQESPVFWLE